MKFRGKAISGTSLLMMLGVVFFATVLVSAIVISSIALQFGPTTVTDPGNIVLTKGTEPGAIYAGNPAEYTFTAKVPQAMTGAFLTITVTEAETIVDGDITSIKVVYDGGEETELTVGTVADGKITATHMIGDQAASDAVPCTVTIVYANAGTYTVSAVLSGTV